MQHLLKWFNLTKNVPVTIIIVNIKIVVTQKRINNIINIIFGECSLKQINKVICNDKGTLIIHLILVPH